MQKRNKAFRKKDTNFLSKIVVIWCIMLLWIIYNRLRLILKLENKLIKTLLSFSIPHSFISVIPFFSGVSVDYLTIPSQRRYVQYFTSMLAGTKPLPAPLLLMRIIMNTIPNFSSNSRFTGCCPYIQVFQNGKLIATAAPPGNEKQNESTKSERLTLKWMNTSDGNVSFILDCAVRVITSL